MIRDRCIGRRIASDESPMNRTTIILGVRWVLAPSCVILGCALCYLGYVKPIDKRAFHPRDLFRTIFSPPQVGGETKVQLFIEGTLCIVIGILGYVAFSELN